MYEIESNAPNSGRSGEWHSPSPSRASDRPPRSFLDARGRYLQLSVGQGLSTETYEALVEMYDAFDPADRVHGLPPLATDTVRDWLDNLRPGLHAVARHDGRVAGHAVLMEVSDEDAHELAIFVRGSYQHARIGTRVLERFCWEADRYGIPAITLFVQSDNRPALDLYRSMGFEGEYVGHGELEMRLDL
mgnify:FL=1